MDCRSFLHQLFVTVQWKRLESFCFQGIRLSCIFLKQFPNHCSWTYEMPKRTQFDQHKKNVFNHQSDFKRA